MEPTSDEVPQSTRDDSQWFGIWPTFIGIGFAIFIAVIMFTIADGMQ